MDHGRTITRNFPPIGTFVTPPLDEPERLLHQGGAQRIDRQSSTTPPQSIVDQNLRKNSESETPVVINTTNAEKQGKEPPQEKKWVDKWKKTIKYKGDEGTHKKNESVIGKMPQLTEVNNETRYETTELKVLQFGTNEASTEDNSNSYHTPPEH